MQKTRNYNMFIFRDDNRDKSKGFNEHHLSRLINSIKDRNMLELRPICVSENMEIIDGQHRLMAAKQLGLEIYYVIKKDSKPDDVILMNICKPWVNSDYLNFYCKQGNKEYLKLKEFCEDNSISITCALNLVCGKSFVNNLKFREGKFVFHIDSEENFISVCVNSIDFIQKNIGKKTFLKSVKFWVAMKRLFNHEDFDLSTWQRNLSRMCDKITPRVDTEAYTDLLFDIYNWKSTKKIYFTKLRQE